MSGKRDLYSSDIKDGRLHVGLDFGGSLVKIAFITGTKTSLFSFKVEKYKEALYVAKGLLEQFPKHSVHATGGGIHKMLAEAQGVLQTEIILVDEMQALVNGICTHQDLPERYPFLLVNVGSGVSIIKVLAKNSYRRVSGTAFGGGTFRGLAFLISGKDDFSENIRLATEGKSDRVDLLVGDIYGTDYASIGLSANVVASAFGKAFSSDCPAPNDADKLAGLLSLMCSNLAQIVSLNAKLHGVTDVYFSGGFFTNSGTPINIAAFMI
jgi:type II pantothenate kinase